MQTILLLEDEPHLRDLYQQELEEENYRVLAARGSGEALRAIRQERVNLVIVDIKLENENGLDVIGQLLAHDKHIKVLINSAYPSYKSDFNSWSADAFLVKSSNLDELKSKVGELLHTTTSA